MNASHLPAASDLRPYFSTVDDLPEPPLRWDQFFGSGHPVELEVGTGRGLFLVTAGLLQPATSFIGIEYDFKEARRAARRLQKRELKNVRIVGVDARKFLPAYVPAGSVAAVHVYFPDPWWKRRHWKRRIFNPEFLAEVSRILQPGGLLHSWTDVESYFENITRLVGRHPDFEVLPPPEERAAAHDMDYHTSFERKKRKLGLPIYRGQWQRRAK